MERSHSSCFSIGLFLFDYLTMDQINPSFPDEALTSYDINIYILIKWYLVDLLHVPYEFKFYRYI